MTEQQVSCPRCRQENPPGNRFCGSCGVRLMSGEQLARRQEHRPVPAGRAWPAKLGPVSKALAVGVAAVATEAGLSWLRQKTGRRGPPSEALVPPRAVISLARVWKKSSSRGGRIPTAGLSRAERYDRSSPRGRPVGEGKKPSPYP
jgi:hypothetical protein